MKIVIALFALLAASLVSAAPFVQATVSAGTTQCGFYLDSGAVVVVAVDTPTTCKLDVGSVAVGAHVVQVDARGDPTWTTPSAKSTALNFTRPAPPAVPTGLTLVP